MNICQQHLHHRKMKSQEHLSKTRWHQTKISSWLTPDEITAMSLFALQLWLTGSHYNMSSITTHALVMVESIYNRTQCHPTSHRNSYGLIEFKLTLSCTIQFAHSISFEQFALILFAPSQIAKTLGSTSIRHRPDTFAAPRYLPSGVNHYASVNWFRLSLCPVPTYHTLIKRNVSFHKLKMVFIFL